MFPAKLSQNPKHDHEIELENSRGTVMRRYEGIEEYLNHRVFGFYANWADVEGIESSQA